MQFSIKVKLPNSCACYNNCNQYAVSTVVIVILLIVGGNIGVDPISLLVRLCNAPHPPLHGKTTWDVCPITEACSIERLLVDVRSLGECIQAWSDAGLDFTEWEGAPSNTSQCACQNRCDATLTTELGRSIFPVVGGNCNPNHKGMSF